MIQTTEQSTQDESKSDSRLQKAAEKLAPWVSLLASAGRIAKVLKDLFHF